MRRTRLSKYLSHLSICAGGSKGVCDLDLARAATCAKLFGANRFYSNHGEMLEREELDVVFIVTNVDETGRPRYPRLAADCLRAGAHAWIEKPPASSTAEI